MIKKKIGSLEVVRKMSGHKNVWSFMCQALLVIAVRNQSLEQWFLIGGNFLLTPSPPTSTGDIWPYLETILVVKTGGADGTAGI